MMAPRNIDLRGALMGCNQSLNGTVKSLLQVKLSPLINGIRGGKGDASGASEDDITTFNPNSISVLVMVGLLVGGLIGMMCAYYYFKASFSYESLESDDEKGTERLTCR